MIVPSTPDISHVAGLLADPSRASIIISLLDGRPQTATELANHAKVTPQTASAHLSKLVSGNLITKEVHGRYRYFRLTDPNVARAIESLIAISGPSEIQSLRDSEEDRALREARTCYDHLAGKLGTNLARSLESHGFVTRSGDDFILTDSGRQFLTQFGINITKAERRRRKFIYPCMDWSERTPHIGGALGAALLDRISELGWIERGMSNRTIRVTEAGQQGFYERFGIPSA
ncbi:helix-turn-helix domain-containing protein [Alicyclobacillus sp. SO9]|uniref:helix-turn-helix domain-containing protein n=1 Tax=Alicyclobacillus sp. SO9 TaxID=2665646 RepID=UPI0018E85DDC|nr:helix-turn-helix domain-containing protein [Alicyclobacillus sp. SO9]QQE80409.1 helix-turn-helix transcriptional regulator [Alicyclobacillus sp. SO9]